jgi:hypothetical protein
LKVSRFDKKNSRFDKSIPGSILTGNYAENLLKCRAFARGQVVAIPSNLQNSRFFSLIDGNCPVETGSMGAASTTTQFDANRPFLVSAK